MTIMQLRYFNAVCQSKNVTKAANELHVSQPSISNAIRDLEDELGVQLFYRIKMRLTLTHEGEFFLRESSQLLSAADRLMQQMKDLGGKRNLVRIGIPPMIGTMIFPQMLISFRKNFPNIKVEVEEYGSLSCMDYVLDESLDLAIIITNAVDSNKLNVLPILETELLFCIDKRHPLAKKKTVGIEDFKDEPLVLLPAGSYNRAQAEEIYNRNGLIPNVLLHSSQLYTIERLLQSGAAAAFLFKEFALNTAGIAGLTVSPSMPAINIGVVWKKDKLLFADVIRFIDFAKRYDPIL